MKHHRNCCGPLLAIALLPACAPAAAPRHPDTALRVRVLGAVTASEQSACEEAVSTVLLDRGSSSYAEVEVALGIDQASIGVFPAFSASRNLSNPQPRISAEITCHRDGKLLRAAAAGLVTAGACTSAAHRLAAELERRTDRK
jgi:hypothetical protein